MSFNMLRLCFLMLCLSQQALALHTGLSLELKEADLADTIRLLAKFQNINIVLAPNISGTASLHLTNAEASQALDLLLTSHDLGKLHVGNVWLIAPRNELIKQKQEELQWQTAKNAASQLVSNIWRLHYAKADELVKLLKSGQTTFLSNRGQVHADVRTNSICIQDIPEKVAEAHRLIKRLDIPTQQILIEARLASVDSDFERDLGIHFASSHPSTESKKFNSVVNQHTGHYSLAVIKLADGSLLDVKLSALEKAGHAELISSPSLFTASQQPAWIEAGEEVPYQEVSESGGTAVAFKKAVLGLKATPQVLPGNRVLLQLQINQDRPSNKMVLGVPTISTRQITTNVLVTSGETIVLGGIYELNREKAEERVPFLSQVPIIGLLFKQQTIRKNKRELLIFVTPKIIS